jgi:hypothetical protein
VVLAFASVLAMMFAAKSSHGHADDVLGKRPPSAQTTTLLSHEERLPKPFKSGGNWCEGQTDQGEPKASTT